MSPRYAPDDIDEVRERADIIEVIGEHVRLRKAGRSYVGLCPFHQEKTGSFNVDPDKKVYFCHGCQAGERQVPHAQEIHYDDHTAGAAREGHDFAPGVEDVSDTELVVALAVAQVLALG